MRIRIVSARVFTLFLHVYQILSVFACVFAFSLSLHIYSHGLFIYIRIVAVDSAGDRQVLVSMFTRIASEALPRPPRIRMLLYACPRSCLPLLYRLQSGLFFFPPCLILINLACYFMPALDLASHYCLTYSQVFYCCINYSRVLYFSFLFFRVHSTSPCIIVSSTVRYSISHFLFFFFLITLNLTSHECIACSKCCILLKIEEPR